MPVSRSKYKFPAVFLDRDGTLNVEKGYVHLPKDWEWIPGAPEALRRFRRMGYKIVVVSNQSGVARGYYSSRDVEIFHRWIAKECARRGARVDAFYFCPHGPGDGCACRKPKPGMILRAARKLKIDLSRSWMIGDHVRDVEAGQAAGVKPLFVLTGHGRGERAGLPPGTKVMKDISSACREIARHSCKIAS
jgi:D-glycero-D-manno-heptose 1,7-bisphosphate phosphatase